MLGSATEPPVPLGRLLPHSLLVPEVLSTKSKEMLLTALGPGVAVKVLKPVTVHCRDELEQARGLSWGAARAREARERTGRKCMVAFGVLGVG